MPGIGGIGEGEMKLSELKELVFLKPCPFCGSSDVGVSVEDEYYSLWSVDCNRCEASGPGFSADQDEEGSYTKEQIASLKEKAINAWNARSEERMTTPTVRSKEKKATNGRGVKDPTFMLKKIVTIRCHDDVKKKLEPIFQDIAEKHDPDVYEQFEPYEDETYETQFFD